VRKIKCQLRKYAQYLGMPSPEAIKEIKTMICSFHSLMVVESVEEERVKELFARASRDLFLPFYEWSISQGLVSTDSPSPLKISEPRAVLRQISEFKGEAVFLLKDFIQHLTTPTIIREFRELTQKLSRTKSMIVLVAPNVVLSPEIQHSAIFYDLKMPTRDQLKKIVVGVMNELSMHKKNGQIKMNLSPEDGDNLLNALIGMTMKQARQAIAYCLMDNNMLDATDIAKILERKAQALKEDGVLDFYPVEGNRFELGGFSRLKEYLSRVQVAYSKEAVGLGIQSPRGVLIVGVPGCGKSLAAKAIARLWKMPLLKLDASRLFDKFIGESEKNFRKAILSAEAMAPSILWIDEIEKVMSSSSGGDADGGLGKRMFGTFLTWLQEKEKSVFVVATANDLSALPPELLRKGRFDEVFFVDLPNKDERTEVFSLHLKLKKQVLDKFNLNILAAATEGFSGAEIEQVVTASLLVSLYQKREMTTELIESQISETVPLSKSRHEDIQRLRDAGRKQFVSVS
jgi:energy-coupling factor transporter ATP-binding protein EcfA2